MKALKNCARLFGACYDRTTAAAYIRQHCAHQQEEVIRQADMLLNNTFIFVDRWDMEPCPTPYTIALSTWLESPNGDPEWVFMLNRHDFLNKLWQAYVLTANDAYLEKLRSFIMDWIEKNPVTLSGTDATRTIDTGIRCMNWSTLLMHLLSEDLLSDADAKLIINSLKNQYTNMRDRYIGKYALSNWGVLQTTAICAGDLWLSDWLSDDMINWAWDELKLQLCLQILDDGSHWEQSAMYHVEVLNTCVKLLAQLRMAERIGKPLREKAALAVAVTDHWTDAMEACAGPGQGYDPEASGWLVGAIRVLSRHVLHTCDPAFLQLPQGDSDVTDVRDVMARAAALLSGGGIYRYAAGDTMDLDSVWILGAPGIRAFQDRKPVEPAVRSWNCAHSGNIFLRTNWKSDADFTWLKCGSLGSSHGHADHTHLTLYHKGKPFLTDSGRYTYLEEDPLRVLLKSACAHNVCTIDDQSGGLPDGSWSYHKYDEVLKNYFNQADGIHYAEMAFHGQLRDGAPYLLKRKVMVLDEGVWLSVQDIVCQGEHSIKEYFHLDEAVCVEKQADAFLLCHDDVAVTLQPGENIKCRTGILSKRYNEKETAPVLVRTNTMRDRFTSCTIIADAAYKVNPVPVYQMRKAEPLPPEAVVAWDVEIADGEKKTLILWNRETYRGDKLYTCHGRSVYGKAAALSWAGENCSVIRLKT